MSTRPLQQPRIAREQRIVLPAAPKEEDIKLESSNTWGRNHLKLLGVDFYMKRKLDLNRVLMVRESEWSSELVKRTPMFEAQFTNTNRCGGRSSTVGGCGHGRPLQWCH